jgi:hypothetical protein
MPQSYHILSIAAMPLTCLSVYAETPGAAANRGVSSLVRWLVSYLIR